MMTKDTYTSDKSSSANPSSKNSRLVYSTETGRVKTIAKAKVVDHSDGIVRLHRESRKGNGVTLIKGLPVDSDIKVLAKLLKTKIGVGGSVKDNVIELQTDQREKVKNLLETKGYTVKIAGG
jgi:translation initiation factor 1